MLCVWSHQKRFFNTNQAWLVDYFSLFPFNLKKFWSTPQTSLCAYFLIENSFSEVDLICKTLHIFNITHLLSWDICVHQWNHPCSQGNPSPPKVFLRLPLPSGVIYTTMRSNTVLQFSNVQFSIVSYVAQLSRPYETKTLYPLNNTSALELSKF